MKIGVKKGLYVYAIGFCVCAIAFFQLSTPCHAFEIDIEIAPNTLNIESENHAVTVHTDIAYGDVSVSSVFLNGVAINSWKADNQGNFVAKFLTDDVKLIPGLVIGGYNTLTLVGTTTDGEAFAGEKDIKVIEIIPRGGR
jgi:hypothetical protein